MYVGGGAAKLTLPHLNKDDEGLYTLRIWTKNGTTEHSAYLFVKGLLQMCPLKHYHTWVMRTKNVEDMQNV